MQPTTVHTIQHPRDFLTLFPDNTLRIRSDAHALSTLKLYQMPSNRVYLRHEHDLDKLYISRSFFTENLASPHILNQLRQYVTFVGVVSMRIDRGTPAHTRKNSGARREQCYIFDLTAPHVLRETQTKTKRGENRAKEMLVDMQKHRLSANKEFNALMLELPDKYYNTRFCQIARIIMRESEKAVKLHEEIINAVQRRRVQAKYRIEKQSAPPRERVRMPELDALIQLFAPGFIKKIDAYRMIDGAMVHKKSEVLPFPIRDKWDAMNVSGLYEETSRADGTGYRKTLWIALHAVRDAVKRGALPKNYMDDKRAIIKENKYIGKTTMRCVKLDMMR